MTDMILDDLNPGDLVTMLHGPVVSQSSILGEMYGMRSDPSEDTRYKGVPLQVVAIETPYLAIRVLPTGEVVCIDTRAGAKFKKISKEYADAFAKPAQQVAVPLTFGGFGVISPNLYGQKSEEE